MKLLALCIGLAIVFGSGEAASPENMPGAPTDMDVDTPGVQSAAKYATTVISDGFKGSYQLGLIRVFKATGQLVSGYNYGLTIAAGRTNCTKGSKDKSVCKVSPGADNSSHVDYNVCEVGVYRSFMPRYQQITKLKCNKPNKNECQTIKECQNSTYYN